MGSGRVPGARASAIVLAAVLLAVGLAPADGPSDTRPLGIGFLWHPRSEQTATRLSTESDFVDLILGGDKLDVFERVPPPVRVVCLSLALERHAARPFPGVQETIELLRDAQIPPERVIIGYNPERSPGTTTEEIERFDVPMIHSAGWYDFYKEGAVEMFRALQTHDGPGARGTQKLIIGPWGHGVLQEQGYGEPLVLPGGMTYPANAKFDWPAEVWLPWFGHWLKGEPTGVMAQPAVRYYLMGADEPGAPGNEWVEADDFPPPAAEVAYHAHADGSLTTAAPVEEEASRSYRYDPADPVPTVGRVHARVPVTGPQDQRPVEGRPDVLLFTTEPLSAPLKIAGQVRVKLWASSDRTDTDFTAKLTDLYPDGRSMIFLDGIVKARYRNTYLQEELLSPGEVYAFELDLGYTAIGLAPGHRLRLAISSSNFDRFDINPNTGEPYGDHALMRALLAERLRAEPPPGEPQYTSALIATNTTYMEAARPTQVLLPTIP